MFSFIGGMIALFLTITFGVAACLLGALAGLVVTAGVIDAIPVATEYCKMGFMWLAIKTTPIRERMSSWYYNTRTAVSNGVSKMAKVIPFRKNGDNQELLGQDDLAYQH